MADLNEALVFAKVVELGSFTGAAANLQLPKATVSRRVRDLEARLATRLLNRTTRRVSPTEAGTAYYEHCVLALRELDDAEAAVGRLQGAPRGWLRITAPLTVGRDFLARPIAEFQKRYPEVRVAMLLTNDVVDLVAEGIDVAVRTGPLADTSYAMRPLTEVRMRLIASPAYLRARGVPRSIADLAQHSLAALSRGGTVGKVSWMLTTGRGRRARTEEVSVDPVIVANDPGPLHAAAVEGVGIALVPEPYVLEDLRAGRVRVVLPEWEGPSVPVTAVFPSRRGMSPKLRVFLDFLVDTFAALAEEVRGSLAVAPTLPQKPGGGGRPARAPRPRRPARESPSDVR
jgi:DNA-binding transcriptional LysR family regulator